MTEPPPPYRSGLATGLGVGLLAGLILASVDMIHTGGGVGFAPALFALWALVTLPFALFIGLVLGAGNAQWGPGWIRRSFAALAEDTELDRSVYAGLCTAVALCAILAIAIAVLSLGLVANVSRKPVGALLLGGASIAILPIFALGALPLYRGVRFANKVALMWFAGPAVVAVGLATYRLGKYAGVAVAVGLVALRIQPVLKQSRVLIMLVVPTVLGLTVGPRLVMKRVDLDWEALNLWSLIMPALLPLVAIGIGILAYGPAAKWRAKLPSRGAIVIGAALLAAVLPLLGLRSPSEATQTAITERSFIGSRLIKVMQKFIDHDHDGYSAFFGGPDCDDNDANVHPNATEIPGNGKDDNCVGGDAKIEVATPEPTGPEVEAKPALSGGKNVLVIFVDTLRYDRLGISGYQRDGKSLTPRIDALAKESVVFDKAFSQAPNTPRSVPSLLTSRYPSQVKVDKVFKAYPSVSDDNDTLFEAMKGGGFTTVGESSHFYFCDRKRYPETCSDVVSYMNSNMTQGADLWDNTGAENIPGSNHDIAGPRIIKKTLTKLDELAKADTKFAMLVHLFEPHSTYMTHDGFKITETGSASLAQKYDYEVAFEDGLIGELLDHLEATGLAKTTTVILMADHGEAFGVHKFAGEQMYFHGQTLYRELIHVPLMFRVPGATPRIAHDVVQMIDLAPTIAALFGVTAPASWVGRSLLPALANQPLAPKPAFSELLRAPDWDHEGKSMVTADGKRHVFYRISDSRWEIYDLEADPDEKTNIADSDPDAKALQQQLAAWIDGPLATGGTK